MAAAEPPEPPVSHFAEPPMPQEPEMPSAENAAPMMQGYAPAPAPYYQPWGGAPYGGWGAPYGGGWNNGWAPWGNGWGNNGWGNNGWGNNGWGNSWMPWGNGWGNNGWGNSWMPWDNGWGNNGWGNSWMPWGNGWGGNGWNDGYNSGYGNGWGNTYGDGYGDLDGEADFSFAARAWMSGDMRGDGYGAGDGYGYGNGYGYQGYGPYLPPPPMMAPPMPMQDEGPADGDRDGVADAGDLCPDTAEGVAVDALGCDDTARIVLRGVNFKTDSADLTDDSLAILDGVSETLSAHPDISVVVAGHTDSDGEDAYNKDLSQRRAQSVVNYLADHGVDRNNMIAKGYGEEQPIATNDTAEGKAQNRRVELNRL